MQAAKRSIFIHNFMLYCFCHNRQTQDFIKGVLLFMSKQTNSKTIKTSIGGQAVIEGGDDARS